MAWCKVSPKVQLSQLWKSGSEGLHRHAHVVCPWPKVAHFQVHKLEPALGHLKKYASELCRSRPKPELSGWTWELVLAFLKVSEK